MQDTTRVQAGSTAKPKLARCAEPPRFFTPAQRQNLKRKRAHYRWAQVGYEQARYLAAYVDRPTPAGGADGWVMPAMPDPGSKGRHHFAAAFAAALVGALDDDVSLLQRAFELVRHGLSQQRGQWWQPASFRMALALDGAWPQLDEPQRAEARQLLRAALDDAPHAQLGGNIGAGHRKAMIAVAAFTDDQDLIDRALHEPACGLYAIVERHLHRDGLWSETAPSYHCYAMIQLMELAWLCRMLGIELERRLWQRIHEGARAVFGLLDSARQMPDTGDTWRPVLGYFGNPNDSLSSSRLFLELMAGLFDDPWAGWALRQTPRDTLDSLAFGVAEPAHETPPAASRCFESSGVAALRCPTPDGFWNGSGLTGYLRFGPHGGWHGHRDALAVELRRGAERHILDRGRPTTYSDISHDRWFRATLAHSTVVVDSADQQKSAGGNPTFFIDRPHVAGVSATCHDAYPDVACERLLVLTDRYAIDRFDLSSLNQHTYHYVLHCDGELAPGTDATPAGPAGDGDGYAFLAEPRQIEPYHANPLRVEPGSWNGGLFRATGGGTQLTWLGQPSDRMLTARAPKAEGEGFGRCVIRERRSADASFLSLIEPYVTEPEVTVSKEHVDADAFMLIVHHRDGRDVICAARSDDVHREFEQVVFHGRFAFVRQDAQGRVVHAHGTTLRALRVGEHNIVEDTHGHPQDL